MQFVDANIVLRYILWDHKELAEKAREIIEHKEIDIISTWTELILYFDNVDRTLQKSWKLL